MDVTNRFVLDYIRRFAAGRPGARILDYGCGAGGVVAAGRDAGLDIVGADVYYGGSQTRLDAEASGLLGTVIQEMRGGRLPFAESSFDLVTNNQVMEHVEDLDAVLCEIDRILKPGGEVLSIFPAGNVFREGHIGIPFSHWFRRESRLRLHYTWALRSLGFGTWKEQAPTRRQWAVDKLRWIDEYTHYRDEREIAATFGRYFSTRSIEPDYIRYRLRDRPRRAPLARLLDIPLVPALATTVFRRLAFMVLVSRKRDV